MPIHGPSDRRLVLALDDLANATSKQDVVEHFENAGAVGVVAASADDDSDWHFGFFSVGAIARAKCSLSKPANLGSREDDGAAGRLKIRH